MLRTILIPVEDDIHGKTAIDHLWRIAPAYQARVYGLRIVDVETLEEGMHETSEARRLLERDAGQHLESFVQMCEQHGLQYRTEIIIGQPIEEIALGAPRADLLLMGEAMSISGEAYNKRKTFVRDVLHRTARSVLIARDGHTDLNRIMVGYDGSEKSAHALQLGADLAERLSSELTVVVAADRKDYGAKLVDDLTWYLEAYRVDWKPVLFEGTPNEAMTRTAGDKKIDLVIVGSHGHGRLHELAFGSTTNHVLEYIRSSILIYR
jgi:nucleotide-binding universal stress UspA family protein